MQSQASSSQQPGKPDARLKKTKKTSEGGKRKKRQKEQSHGAATENGRNEGTDPHWAYEPPKSAVLLNYDEESGEFDWDAINDNPDLQIWVLRVPDAIKSKHLDGLSFQRPDSSKSAKLGTVSRNPKHASYDIWSVREGDDHPVGGEELTGLSCMLPSRSKKGKLYSAPRGIDHHLMLSAQPPQPTVTADPISHKQPPREIHLKELLKHRFMPYGSETATEESTDMDVVPELVGEVDLAPAFEQSKEDGISQPKRKKRKGEPESPKKSKKVKPTT